MQICVMCPCRPVVAVSHLIGWIILLALICPAHIDALEVYAGCGGWTKACHSCGLKVGPLIDKFGKGRWDLLSAKWRRLLWAVMVVCKPTWIHSGFPCTFWVLMAHLTCRLTSARKETKRMQALVHVVLTLQLAMWQRQHNLIMSFENPPGAQSWRLDIVLQTMRITGMKQVYFDSCAWGHHDPVSMKPYLKPQCIAASVDLSPLERRCSCAGGRKAGVHERIEGSKGSRSSWVEIQHSSDRPFWAVSKCALPCLGSAGK